MKVTALQSSRPLNVIIAAFLIAAGVLMGGASAHAESGQAFTISPPLLEMDATPGSVTRAKISLTNVSSGTLSMSVQTNDFGSKNETGEPNIIFDEGHETPYSMKNWITKPGDFTLKSKETRDLTVPIKVPSNAEPGGHYAVIRFTGTTPAGESQQVALSASIGSLVLLKVAGDIQQSAAVEDFYAATQKFEKRSFFESPPVSLVTRIRNTGNLHVKPSGTVVVKDMFGKEISTLRMNGDPSNPKDSPGSVLPQSVRRFDVTQPDGAFGRYTATMTLNYGDGKVLEKTTGYWVVPYRAILGVLLVTGLVVFGLIKGIKRYNAYIIEKAKKQSPDNSDK